MKEVVFVVAALMLVGSAEARAAVFVVSTTDDAGPGSLRKAINQANAAPGIDRIDFAIGSGVRTITPLSPVHARGLAPGSTSRQIRAPCAGSRLLAGCPVSRLSVLGTARSAVVEAASRM